MDNRNKSRGDSDDESIDCDASDLEGEEEEYERNDAVKKWQFNYNKSTCFSNNYPEIGYKEDTSNLLSIAPGEGKLPTNILEEQDWDIKSFPCLYPDGKNSLHSDRPLKITEQEYFNQRILNKDSRFCQNLGFVFLAIAFLEKKQMERNKGISFIRGKSVKQFDGSHTYSLEDPYSVLDNIKNTPRYWLRARNELIAKLENLGPFSIFFTLSCADMRWPENFTSLLQDQNISYTYKNGEEEILINGEDWKEWLKANESQHDFIRNNLLNATLTFHHRVKMFMKHIVMSKGNPLSIKYHSYKVEFALRGAAHVHGVLWIDWENINNIPKNEIGFIKKALQNIKDDIKLDDKELSAIVKFADSFISCSLKDPRTSDIVQSVNKHHHTKTCRKYGSECRFYFPRFPSIRTIVSVPVKLSNVPEEKQETEYLKAKAILKKVQDVLQDEKLVEEVCNINKIEIEKYKHVLKSIQKINIVLSENLEDSISITEKDILQDLFFLDENIDKLTVKRSALMDKLSVLENDLMNINIHDLEKQRLIALLNKADIQAASDKDLLELYENALSLSQHGYKIIHKRDVNEIYINNYNSEWIHSWNANMDIQLCLDFFAIITYISDYYSKDDSGTMKFIKEALKQADNEGLRQKLAIVVHQFLTHRQIGESEAYFRLLPHLHLKESNVDTEFIQTGFKQNRSKFLKKLTDDELNYCKVVVQVSGRDGYYTEKPSLLDKYMRRDFSVHPDVHDITYLQFGKRYVATRTGPKDDKDFKPLVFDKHSMSSKENHCDLDFIVTDNFLSLDKPKLLPKFIKINNPELGEPAFMKLRSPMVARFHKFSKRKNTHEFYYSELQLYRPFTSEDELHFNNLDECKNLYEEKSLFNGEKKISNVKKILMPNLEVVEEATEKAYEMIESNAGTVLDPENEQDNADCAEVGVEDHPDFAFKSIADYNNECMESNTTKSFKKIELYDDEYVERLTRGLDKEQRTVLDIGVDYAKNVAKARSGSKRTFHAPLLIVQGGAGSGKSTVIEAMSQQMERIFRTPGDNPNYPYILKAAFTGTAAAKIKGQTLHSAFSFNFGNEFLSLGDKSRDEKRTVLQNLKAVIIDEYSMIKSDMLYQLDLRLKEIKQRLDLPFGGVAVFFFGDVLQLRPVQARYIFDEPISESYNLAHMTDPLWKKFAIILLVNNHRQGDDKVYADILNRIRVGEINEDDMQELRGRVRPVGSKDIPKNALVVTCKNNDVNMINSHKLSELDSPEYFNEAVVRSQTQKCIKPKVDSSGAIRNTPLQKTLSLKVKARVMLTFNIDTCDSLTNGAFGEILGFEFGKNGELSKVIVQFDEDDCGKERRKKDMLIKNKYGEYATAIEKIEFQYCMSKKATSASSTATVLQFPLRLAFAATAHKVQGATVKKPSSLVIDLRSVREAAQAYVMLSRVQAIEQLFILDSLPEHKIYSCSQALDELSRLSNAALNNNYRKINILSCNIRSLQKHFGDIRAYPQIENSDVICLQETWLDPLATSSFSIGDLKTHSNSVGRGKGIVTFYNDKFEHIKSVREAKYQMTKISSSKEDIINIYRSEGASSEQLIKDFKILFNRKKKTFIVGDLNICYSKDRFHRVLRALTSLGFKSLVQYPTHVSGGYIDHMHVYSPPDAEQEIKVNVQQQGVYFTDHDLILMSDITVSRLSHIFYSFTSVCF